MSAATVELKKDIQQGKEALQMLRDEVRLKIHLAGMDAKDEWRALEPRVLAAEDAAREATEVSRKALRETLTEVEKFVKSLV